MSRLRLHLLAVGLLICQFLVLCWPEKGRRSMTTPDFVMTASTFLRVRVLWRWCREAEPSGSRVAQRIAVKPNSSRTEFSVFDLDLLHNCHLFSVRFAQCPIFLHLCFLCIYEVHMFLVVSFVYSRSTHIFLVSPARCLMIILACFSRSREGFLCFVNS